MDPIPGIDLARRTPSMGTVTLAVVGALFIATGWAAAILHEPPPHPRTRAPRRIVSVSLAADEILADLVPPSRLAAVTHFIDDPSFSPMAGQLPRSVARIHDSPEAIVARQPDLLVIGSFTAAGTAASLRAAGVPVLRLGPARSFDEVAANIERLGRATGRLEKARTMGRELHRRLRTTTRRVAGRPRPRVLVLGPGRTASGHRTLVSRAVHLAGGIDVVAGAGLSGSVTLPLESVLALQPEVLVVAASGTAAARQRVRRWTGASSLPAVRHGRVHALPSALLACQSHRSVALVEALASRLHPHGDAR